MVEDPLIEVARRHYANMEVREIPVPEWGRSIFVNPTTLGEQQAIYQLQQTKKLKGIAVLALTVCMQARNADGERAFKDEDLDTLINEVDPKVIERVATEILNTSEAEHLKN